MGRIVFLIGVLALGYLLMPGWANLDDVKANAEQTFERNGWTVEGYEGYEWSKWWGGPYGGARVWYTLSRDNNGVTYQGFIKRWGDEYHIYGPTAIDAIKPK